MIYIIIAGILCIFTIILVSVYEFDKTARVMLLSIICPTICVVVWLIGMSITFWSISEYETQVVAEDYLIPIEDDVYLIHSKNSSLFSTTYILSYNSDEEEGIKMKKLNTSNNITYNFVETSPKIIKSEKKKILTTKMSFWKLKLNNTWYSDIVIEESYVVEVPEGSILYSY